MEQRQYRGLTKEGKWVYGWYYIKHRHLTKPRHIISEPHPMGNEHEVIPESVRQQIGKKDKSGTEIYEGDIVAFVVMERKHICVVKYHITLASFLMTAPKTEQAVGWSFADRKEFIEVIGNIHQNPNLIEQHNE